MASDALEEKINKIRLQNEEIRRRYEEVEADKKNAAKLNALVQLVPSDDWPERKEPPEFSAPSKNVQKPKTAGKEHNDRPSQHYPGIQERIGKKDHKFAQGEGPPPDPKYNFLADSEREMRGVEDVKSEEDKNKSRNKTPRGGSRKRGGSVGNAAGAGGGGSREAFFKDNRGPNAFHSKEESLPEYEAWRAERNKIDEARIKRQKTAEGNWRREWDSNKTSIDKEPFKKGDSNRKDYERRNNYYNNDYSNRGQSGSGSRTYHGSQKNHAQDHRRPHHEQTHDFKRDKRVSSPTEDRSIAAIDKSVKVTINQAKGPVMSVKVNSPSIAGTGRVGPRQKSRVTYSSQSDAEMPTHEVSNFSRQKSFDEKTATASFNNGQKAAPKSPFAQRKKDGNPKSPFPQRKEYKNDELSARPNKNPKASRNEGRDQRQSNNNASKPQRAQRRTQKPIDKNEMASASDNAIPSEYNPEKPLNPVESAESKVNSENNTEKILHENNVNLTLQDSLKNKDDSASNSTEQNLCDVTENSLKNDSASNTEQNLCDVTENSLKNDSASNTEQNLCDVTENSLKNDSVGNTEQNLCDVTENSLKNDTVSNAEQNLCDVTENLLKNTDDSVSITEQKECDVTENLLKNTDDSVSTTKQNICDIQNSVTNNNETTKDNEAPLNPESDVSSKPDVVIEHIENIETNLETENNQGSNQIEEQINGEISNSNEQIRNENKEKNSNEESIVPELQTSDILKDKSYTTPNLQEKTSEVVGDTTEEVHVVTDSNNIVKKEVITDQKNDELTETNTSESQQINVVSKTEPDITSDTNVTDNSIEIDKLNKKQDDNIVDVKSNDESIEMDKRKIVEITNSSQNISVNDSGFIDDSDNLNNISTIESNQEKNEKNNEENNEKIYQESDKSDSEVLTKEICDKTEICDIRAASTEISQAVEVDTEKNEGKQGLSTTLEDSTKDCEVNIQKDVTESSETSKINNFQKVTDNESILKPAEENVVEEKSAIATDESKKD